MKTKLTLTVEKELIQQAKKIADAQETSVSSLVEGFLSGLILKRQQSFSQKWRGEFKQAPQGNGRSSLLASRHNAAALRR
ncbi:MAG: hypothetical protein KDM91_20180 [Verrucomicrobiae bacterium]|nr:hypothetical protein [Verrucomicrobiae bacterium]MCP5540846.1 hypothetical protein [Akkermansiaceae bacterium]